MENDRAFLVNLQSETTWEKSTLKNLTKDSFKLVPLSKIEPYDVSQEHTQTHTDTNTHAFKKIYQTRMK